MNEIFMPDEDGYRFTWDEFLVYALSEDFENTGEYGHFCIYCGEEFVDTDLWFTCHQKNCRDKWERGNYGI